MKSVEDLKSRPHLKPKYERWIEEFYKYASIKLRGKDFSVFEQAFRGVILENNPFWEHFLGELIGLCSAKLDRHGVSVKSHNKMQKRSFLEHQKKLTEACDALTDYINQNRVMVFDELFLVSKAAPFRKQEGEIDVRSILSSLGEMRRYIDLGTKIGMERLKANPNRARLLFQIYFSKLNELNGGLPESVSTKFAVMLDFLDLENRKKNETFQDMGTRLLKRIMAPLDSEKRHRSIF